MPFEFNFDLLSFVLGAGPFMALTVIVLWRVSARAERAEAQVKDLQAEMAAVKAASAEREKKLKSEVRAAKRALETARNFLARIDTGEEG